MPANPVGRLRRLAPALFVVVLAAGSYGFARIPPVSAAERDAAAAGFAFTRLPVELPPGLARNTVRTVNPKYEDIRSWVSSVGAAVAVNDLDGGGTADDLCLVDTRSDSAVVTPVPGTGATYTPFVLDPAPLPTGPAMAPMGCVPGDFNSDGRMDLIVYYWGRTPVLYLRKADATGLSNAAYRPTELVPQAETSDDRYRGPLWNTNAVSVADFDGDGHPDVGVFNYFPDSAVLDPAGQPNVQMNHSMSNARNAGGAHILRWTGATGGAEPVVTFQEQDAIPYEYATGWTLAASSADVDDDLLPELYVANDFGPDHFFRNVSTPGRIAFRLVQGDRGPFDPKSLVVGHDSFKGMGVDFGDLRNSGSFDMFVSNITTSWGLEESNFFWKASTTSAAAARDTMAGGRAPFENDAADFGLAWVGWGWDIKMADLDNSGDMAVVQAAGFVKGDINRWSWLQELAATNDLMLQDPTLWPHARPGDDIAGSQPFAVWAKDPAKDDHYVDIAPSLGMTDTTPSRGIAVADTTGSGSQDFAVARQWGAPEFWRNDRKADGDFLGLRLCRPAEGNPGAGTPAYGAKVEITMADGRTRVAQLDGGGGHSGKRSFDVFFGLGQAGAQPVSAEVSWRSADGSAHRQTLSLQPGWHTLMLTTEAKEVPAR
ncbi:CRTAC1 family protein [Actinoplanes sp. G11-F43]|uniref:CRTAC1 family protein n=1 Tax=Actinoplanes sp. G11-F43 TaxID=3424130 RepID=UPI003D348908